MTRNPLKIAVLLLCFSMLTVVCQAQPLPTSGLDGVSVVTSFAHDRGDIPEYVLYKGERFELDEAANALIPKLGWEDVEKREDIAMAWVEQIELATLSILRHQPDKDVLPDFHPPKVIRFDDGSVEVKVWVRHPVGMRPETHYSRHHFLISNEGELSETVLSSMNVQF